MISSVTFLYQKTFSLKMDNKTKVLEVFFNEPLEEHYFREIQRNSGVSPNTLQKVLKELLSEKLIKYSKEVGNTLLYKAELDNPEFKIKKKAYNFQKLTSCGLIELLVEKYSPNAIILFGSFKDGCDIFESDVDIYLYFKKPPKIETKDLVRFEKILNRKLSLHTQDFSKMPKELKNNIINGFTLYGFLKVF